jgi:hypothetical protein
MAKYVKETPRICVKFIDADTDTELFEIKDRNWMNVGEILSVSITNSLVMNHIKNGKLPKKIMVIAISECDLIDD